MGFSGVLMSEIPCKLYFCFCVCLCFLTPCLVGEKRKERLWVLLFSLLLWFPLRKTSTQRKPCSSILLLVSVELEVVVFFRFFLFSCIFSETNRTIMVCSFATLIISMFFWPVLGTNLFQDMIFLLVFADFTSLVLFSSV